MAVLEAAIGAEVHQFLVVYIYLRMDRRPRPSVMGLEEIGEERRMRGYGGGGWRRGYIHHPLPSRFAITVNPLRCCYDRWFGVSFTQKASQQNGVALAIKFNSASRKILFDVGGDE